MSIIKVIIPEFQVYTPTTVEPEGTKFYPFKLEDSEESYQAELADDFEIDTFNHFPLLLLPDRTLWEHANNYLLHKLESFNLPHSSTLSSIADSIKYFGNYCVDFKINYLVCTRKSNSPLRKYRRYLSDRILKRELSVSTVKSHMSNLVNFYRHLVNVEHISFGYPPWHDREAKVIINGQLKEVKTSDVLQAIKGGKSTARKREECTYEGHIIDGAELRPLDEDEQGILITALKQLNNIEMTFIFLIGLCTGARLQTILTLRYENFNHEPDAAVNEVVIYAGLTNKNGSGLVDSKADKDIAIYFPIELYQKIKIYLHSERAIKRRKKSVYKPTNVDFHYLFLSQQGHPFYISKADYNSKFYKKIPTGQTVTTFVCERLKPKLIELGFLGSFKFHDTRATFGMNIVNYGLENIDSENNIGRSIDLLFRFVKVRMNHNDLATTQQYLDFNQNQKIVKEAKVGWEKHLKSMLEITDA
ncbi:site-specific integrase [Moritella marina ATCC 15381]|uniref:Site-specific integrase n=1 Tax=Moritella marina ATCC 15381 TaxID=1202962 RepID=A0A5J6WKR1_MORMI|nr:site-specific integrase [Moritella marina]QFI37012.1 site-specific integrase [Moritella marina ATCC 15381]